MALTCDIGEMRAVKENGSVTIYSRCRDDFGTEHYKYEATGGDNHGFGKMVCVLVDRFSGWSSDTHT